MQSCIVYCPSLKIGKGYSGTFYSKPINVYEDPEALTLCLVKWKTVWRLALGANGGVSFPASLSVELLQAHQSMHD